jgi:ubiquinone/menaquinone biosynthesis C-methylase UbiE
MSDLSEDQRGRQSRHSDEEHRRYWSLSERERQEFLRASYAQRDPKDPYATSRDYNARDLEIQSIIEHVKPGVVLDLGCGNGLTLLRIAEKRTGSFVGVDFSDHLISGAKELAAASGLAKAPDFICADAIQYISSQDSCSVDCIITERFIQNLPSREWQNSVLADIMRVLKPGGRALICEGSDTGFERLNDLRENVGLSRIPPTSADNVTALRLADTDFESYCRELGFNLIRKCGYSLYFVITRVLHPMLVAPASPRFDAKINDMARAIQSHTSFDAAYGGNVLWVLERPENPLA